MLLYAWKFVSPTQLSSFFVPQFPLHLLSAFLILFCRGSSCCEQEMSDKIKQRSSGKEEFYAKKVGKRKIWVFQSDSSTWLRWPSKARFGSIAGIQAELRTQLEELSGKMDELQAKKEDIDKAVGNKREEGREMRSQLNTMKRLGASWFLPTPFCCSFGVFKRVHNEYTTSTLITWKQRVVQEVHRLQQRAGDWQPHCQHRVPAVHRVRAPEGAPYGTNQNGTDQFQKQKKKTLLKCFVMM